MHAGHFIFGRGMNEVGTLRVTELREAEVEGLIGIIAGWIPGGYFRFEQCGTDIRSIVVGRSSTTTCPRGIVGCVQINTTNSIPHAT